MVLNEQLGSLSALSDDRLENLTPRPQIQLQRPGAALLVM